ncbi:MAG: carbohydrate ABC transporter permease [Calditrichaeota bacterium]|nr:carbohydrate ABC transporter permease [Calditrichota bacterium]
MTNKLSAASIFRQVILILGALVFSIPFFWMIITSFKTPQQIVSDLNLISIFIPKPIRWVNYKDIFQLVPFAKFFLNTTLVTLSSILGVTFASSLVAFSFARLKWPGRNAVFVVLLATMMLPYQVTMVPQFLIFRSLGWVNTLKPLWIPSLFGTAFFIFLLRQFFLSIPKDLIDSARIDGCGYFRIYWDIMLPLVKPALLAVVIFQFMNAWNDLLSPLIYIHRQDLMTLSIGLQVFQSSRATEWNLVMAAASLMTLPIVIVFFVAQKYFIQGVTLTGLKG